MSSVKVLQTAVCRELASIRVELDKVGVLEQSTVILVGSLARAARTWRSDTDFVVVTPVPVKRWSIPIDVHIHLTTREAFLQKLDEGNDFEAWTIRFGKVCLDPSGWWLSFIGKGRDQKWPDWRVKVKHARKRQSMARAMLDIGDHDAAEEEYLMAEAHIARALLLRSGVFPCLDPRCRDNWPRSARSTTQRYSIA